MNVSFDTNAIFPCTGCTQKTVLKQQRQINEVGSGNSTVEAEEKPKFSLLSFRRELSPEEQQRVEFLKNLLVQTLTAAQGDPTDDQKKQIREIENELEKITGVKVRSRISSVTDKMPGKDDEDDEKRKQEQQAKGIDPKEAVHNNVQIQATPMNPGMQMLRNNALLSSIQLAEFKALAD